MRWANLSIPVSAPGPSWSAPPWRHLTIRARPRLGYAVGRSGGAVSPDEEAMKVSAASAISAAHNRSREASYSLAEATASKMEGPKDEALMAAYQKGDGRAF